MRIAVVGAGLFGATAAIYAARAGHETHLFEAKAGLMLGASAATFARLHRGAHYPRSAETGLESRRAERSFRGEYGPAIIDGGIQRYVVAPGSLVSVDEYRAFLDNESLPFSEDGGVFTVEEPRINLEMLSALAREKVSQAGVHVHLGVKPGRELRSQFDRIVVATYASLNDTLAALDCAPEAYRYQVVEKIVARLPEQFKGQSTVVVDGPFGCVDPMDDTDCHIIGHVTKTIHASNTGHHAIVPPHMMPLLDRGLITDTRCTRFRETVDDLARWIPGLDEAEYVGSQFTTRAVLAHQESTDQRPTLVSQIDEQISTIFSGKLGTCVTAAQAVCDMLLLKERVAA